MHILFSLARATSIANVVEETKKSSSKWMKRQGVRAFGWQAGYGAFSVSESNTADVIQYIARQEEHHQRMTFQDEFRRFLDRYGVAYDETYLWD